MVEINDNVEFDAVLAGSDCVVVDFHALWCGPCKMFGPVFEETALEHSDVIFIKTDIDKAPNIAMHYGVMSVPTIILFKNGEPVKKVSGTLSKQELKQFITE